MTDLASYAQKFFIFSGFLLIAVAAFQLMLRSREAPRARPKLRFDAPTLRVLLFFAVGVFALLVGFGVLPMPRPR